MQMRLRRSVLSLAAIFVVVAAGCGGGASAEEKWANSVCTYVADWSGTLKQARDDITAQLQSPKAGTLAAIEAEVRKAGDATNQLASNLKALNAPNTESGAKAKQQLDAFASQLQTAAAKAKESLQSAAGANVSELVKALAPLAPELQSLSTSASSTLDAVQASGSDLKNGFQKADACKQFRS